MQISLLAYTQETLHQVTRICMSAEFHPLVPAVESTDPHQTYLDVRALSARTGLSVSTIHRLKKEKKIPYFQPGGPRGRILFPEDAIELGCHANVDGQKTISENSAEKSRLSGPRPAWMQNLNS